MQKPITVAREELIDRLQEDINESGLPAFLISDILNIFQSKLKELEQTQYQRDYEMWAKSQEESKESNETRGD